MAEIPDTKKNKDSSNQVQAQPSLTEDAIQGAQNLVDPAIYGSIVNSPVKSLVGKLPQVVSGFNKANAPKLISQAANLVNKAKVPLMRSPGVGTMATTGYAAYKGADYLMDKTGARDALAKLLGGNYKDYSVSDDQQSKNEALMEQGYNPYSPIINPRNQRVTGYNRTPGYESFVAAGGNPSEYANRNDDAPAMPQGQVNLNAVQFAAPAEQPNLNQVQPQAQAQAPNLQSIEGMPAENPQEPKTGDLIGSYQDSQGRNVGIFEGMPLRDKNTGEVTYINQDQLNSLENSMDNAGMPVISGTKEGNLVPAIDRDTGALVYANEDQAGRMNAATAQQKTEDRAAQISSINNFIESGESNRRIQAAQAAGPEQRFVSSYDQDSAARQARASEPSTFNDTFKSVNSGSDGLSDAQRSKIYGRGTSEYEQSKAGINPRTGNSIAQENAEQQQINEYRQVQIDNIKKSSPDKYDDAKSTAESIVSSDSYSGLNPDEKQKVKDALILQILGIGTGSEGDDIDEIVNPIEEIEVN